jgi:predicted acetyltransferase
MALKTREAHHEQDAEKIQSVWTWVYGLAAPTESLDPPVEGEKRYIGEENGVTTTACRVNDYLVARGNAQVRCGGVAAVATLAEHRQQGHGTQFMKDLLRLMKENGQPISSLYAFRDPWYAKLGYATCGWRWKIVCPAHRFPKTENTLPTRQIATENVSELNDCYTAYIRNHSGSVLRTPTQWQKRMGSAQKPPLVFAVGDPIEGYAWIKVTQFWGDADVGEVAWSTERGRQSILAAIRGFCHNQTTITWMEPPNSRLLATNFDQGIEMSLYRPTMHRVLDVEAAVKALKPQGSGVLSFSVQDPLITENDGAWRAEWNEGEVNIERTPRADIAMDIQAFSQAYMGAPSITDLANHRLIDVRNAAALHEATQLFSPMPVCCMEFF